MKPAIVEFERSVSCQVLTPAGAAAIAVVRVRGAGAWDLLRRFVSARAGDLPDAPVMGRVYFGSFRQGGDALDEVLLAARIDEADGTPCVDLSCHGGRRVVERILLALQDAGAAIIGGDAHLPSSDWRGALLRQLDACLARTTTQRGALYVLGQREHLPGVLGEIIALAECGAVTESRSRMEELLRASHGSHRFHEPAEIVLVGAPNVGKSSLANRLAGRDGAIVADCPGTTRDWVTISAALDGVPVTLIDTAGGHDSGDELETQAIAAGMRRAVSADLVVQVLDASVACGADLFRRMDGARIPDLIAINKIDLEPFEGRPQCPTPAAPSVCVSARTGEGVATLRDALLVALGVGGRAASDDSAAVVDRSLRERLLAVCAGPQRSALDEFRALKRAIGGE